MGSTTIDGRHIICACYFFFSFFYDTYFSKIQIPMDGPADVENGRSEEGANLIH